MSKITLPIAELKPALTGLAKVINRHSALPILNHIKMERTKDGWIALTASSPMPRTSPWRAVDRPRRVTWKATPGGAIAANSGSAQVLTDGTIAPIRARSP